MRSLAILLLATLAAGADDYTGPRPPKADVLYLVHASNLIPTEVTEAQQEGKKDESTYFVSGAASSVRTPLAEPIFLLRSEKIRADALELYRFEVKNGRRQLTLSRKRSDKSGPFHLSITKLDKDLYRVEADEALENGEYSLSPDKSNVVFCFQVY
ncbi:MAG TPA: hypothetical protein VE958_17785 [Bryobacteraceae bacterium]|jgi:hypothetical protein|nr:hypothetical protein [Bryobacteraceae bacterium]